MPRLRPGLARVEFFAVREEVQLLLKQGHTYASAYDVLIKKGKITMCYGAFRSYANGSRDKKSPVNDAGEPEGSQPCQPKGAREPRKPIISGSAFDTQNTPDTADLLKVKE